MNIYKFEKLDSSNIKAQELLEEDKLKDGDVVLVENQTNGKGQNNNVWISESGKNLTFSIILKPSFLDPNRQFYFSKSIVLAVSDFVNNYFEESKIKWFNDVYVNDKKIAGILIENSWVGSKIIASVVGIGININQEKFSSEIPNATSLKNECNKTYNLDKCLEEVLFCISKRYDFLKGDNWSQIDDDYNNRLYAKNNVKSFEKDGSVLQCKILNVESDGRIKLEMPNKSIEIFDMNEIRMI